MGYDMYWHCQPTESEAFQKQREIERRIWDLISEARENDTRDQLQPQIDKLRDESDALEVWYYRLNIWGMGEARDALVPFGVINCDYDEMPDFPRIEGEYDDLSDKDRARYDTAISETLDWTPNGDNHGIPIHKLGSNDGWHVTPGEIRTGLGWADKYHPGWRDGLEDFVLGWVEWMEQAAEIGEGFDVH